jgi:hypothetical protein
LSRPLLAHRPRQAGSAAERQNVRARGVKLPFAAGREKRGTLSRSVDSGRRREAAPLTAHSWQPVVSPSRLRPLRGRERARGVEERSRMSFAVGLRREPFLLSVPWVGSAATDLPRCGRRRSAGLVGGGLTSVSSRRRRSVPQRQRLWRFGREPAHTRSGARPLEIPGSGGAAETQDVSQRKVVAGGARH